VKNFALEDFHENDYKMFLEYFENSLEKAVEYS
jgi:hypothetical protein